MKKLFAILLALVMVFAMSATAFAAEDTTLTITNSTDRTYAGYKLLNLTTSLKSDEHHPNTCTGEHDSNCYNYAYTVNATYRAILQEEVLKYGGNYIWENIQVPADYTGVTDDQIMKYLSNQTSDEGDVYHTMRIVADRLFRAIQDKNITADETALVGNDTLEQGYWIIAETTANLAEGEAKTLVMVDTKGQDELTINPKIGLPTIEKKVKDIDDSEDDKIADNAWQDSADHDIGDTVPFKLTATLPSNLQGYQTYKLIFHDNLSAGLNLKPATVKVYMYETAYKANVDTDVNDGIDVTDNFVLTTNGINFEIACDNILGISGVTKETAFVVYYEAVLNESAVIGDAGNPNEVYLEFSNDPYGDTTTTTEKDKVTVFTYQVIINKVDSHGHALKGAGFKLYKKNLAGLYVLIGEEQKGADMTTFTWTGLDDGDYKLEESTVPEGYNKMSDILFSITATHDENSPDPALTALDGGVMGAGIVGIGVAGTGTITKDIENKTGAVLPETGAQGTFMLITAGAVLVAAAVIFMITRKKMSIYED